jgi:hypothetical protein
MTYFQLNKHWRIKQQDTELYIFGGQDAIFTIDLDSNRRSFFGSLKHGSKFAITDLGTEDRIILEQLLSAEVITPQLKSKQKVASIKLVGDALSIPEKNDNIRITNGGQFDLMVLVRTKGTLTSFLNQQNYITIEKPHLFLDLAFNHTISLGPLVFPGSTSCVACLEGRLKTRWGDDLPPPTPKTVTELAGLAKEWLIVELSKLFGDEDYSLVNKTIVLDAQNRTMTTNKLLTVPLCSYCQKSKLLLNGKLEYTFTKAKQ